MIEISSSDTLYMYNLYHLTKAFFPNEEITQTVKEGQEPLIRIVLEGGSCLSVPGEAVSFIVDRQEKKRFVTKRAYDFLCETTGRSLAWGMLTGVRPTKLIMQNLEKGMSEAAVLDFLEGTYGVSRKKGRLGIEIAEREKRLLGQLDYENGYSLYVGIPFCPSICAYCSFGSAPIAGWEDKTDAYLSAVLKELENYSKMAKEKGKKLNTIYIGGGTPTTLTAGQLERLLSWLDGHFSYGDLKEFTVEAGRPDSITPDKLRVLKAHPVTRISINPQTMQQRTLDLVGRRHTAEDVKLIFYQARSMGFDNINMDLIAGLPGEAAADMADTLRQIEALAPDSLTVHALAIKRAARYGQERRAEKKCVDSEMAGETEARHSDQEGVEKKSMYGSDIEAMIELGAETAGRLDLKPYYLYRQKNIAGNFENVGYAKVDKAGIYNILIMEEKQTILAAGAGASTKIVLPEKQRMENGKLSNLVRIENVKNIREYMDRIDEMIERKGEWLWR